MNIRKVVCIILSLIIFAAVICGCEKKLQETAMKTLIWYYINDNNNGDQEVFDSANKIIAKELGVKVDFRPLSMEEYDKKMLLKASASEKFDLAFTGDWIFDYRENVKNGAFAEIEALIDQYAPKTKENIIDAVWEGVKVDNHIYAIPNYQVSFRQQTLVMKKELVEKYNLQEAIDEAKTIKDFIPILKIIKEKEPDIIPTSIRPNVWNGVFGDSTFYYEQPIAGIPIGIDLDGNVHKLSESPYSDINMQQSLLSIEWKEAGFYHQDHDIKTDYTAEKNAGRIFLFEDVYKPGLDIDMQQRYGYPVYIKTVGIPQLTNDSVNAALTAVSRTSSDKVTAVKLIELLNTNKELYNLLVYGIEDRDYRKTGDNRIQILPDKVYSAYAWVMGSQFNAYIMEGQPDNVWEETKRLNEKAPKSILFGKYIKTESISQNISNILELREETGVTMEEKNYPDAMREFYKKIEHDLDIIYDEVKRQIAQFKNE